MKYEFLMIFSKNAVQKVNVYIEVHRLQKMEDLFDDSFDLVSIYLISNG